MKAKAQISAIIEKSMEDARWRGGAIAAFKMIGEIVNEKPVARNHIEMIKRLVEPFLEKRPENPPVRDGAPLNRRVF